MPQMVSLSEAARECFREGVDEIRSEMELPSFSEWLGWVWSKLEAYLARFSLIVGMCRVVESGPGTSERIEADDVLRASILLGYFKSHARRVYARRRSRYGRLPQEGWNSSALLWVSLVLPPPKALIV
jgi:putative DNA primase/helicase